MYVYGLLYSRVESSSQYYSTLYFVCQYHGRVRVKKTQIHLAAVGVHQKIKIQRLGAPVD
jgi:hypothetical protein